MNRAGTGIGGHVITQDHRHLLVVDRVLENQILKSRASTGCQHFVALNLPAGHDAIDHVGSQDHPLRAVPDIGLYQCIVQIGIKGNGLVSRNGPGRGGPDNHGHIAIAIIGAEQ